MPSPAKSNDTIKIRNNDYARNNENIHIHLSSDLPRVDGGLYSCDCIELFCLVSGSLRFEFESAEYLAQPGDIVFINTNIPYRISCQDKGEPPIYYDLMFNSGILARDLYPSYPYKLLEGSFAFYTLRDSENSPYIFFNFSKSANSTYGELFNKMYMEYKNAKHGYNDALMAYLTLIIINAVRQNEAFSSDNEKNYRKQAITFVQNYINRCFCDTNISVSGLADKVYLNVDYLGRIYKKATGNSITEALQKKRIERVCHLLTTTDQSINDIARACGFTDMHFFYRVFKKRMGVLPGEYRENTKKQT